MPRAQRMNCLHCNNLGRPNDKFCSECGWPLLGTYPIEPVASETFEAIVSGKRKFHLLSGRTNLQEGDMLLLQERNFKAHPVINATGRYWLQRVTHVCRFNPHTRSAFGKETKEHGLQIVSLE
jgi:hypothetical protein